MHAKVSGLEIPGLFKLNVSDWIFNFMSGVQGHCRMTVKVEEEEKCKIVVVFKYV